MGNGDGNREQSSSNCQPLAAQSPVHGPPSTVERFERRAINAADKRRLWTWPCGGTSTSTRINININITLSVCLLHGFHPLTIETKEAQGRTWLTMATLTVRLRYTSLREAVSDAQQSQMKSRTIHSS